VKLELQRISLLPDRTLGELSIEENNSSKKKFCDTLERAYREKKIEGETCIPYGTYKVDFTYSSHFKRNMPVLLDVPDFEAIEIHPGNDIQDSRGCILVGISNGKGQLIQSRGTSDKLNDVIHRALLVGEEIIIEII